MTFKTGSEKSHHGPDDPDPVLPKPEQRQDEHEGDQRDADDRPSVNEDAPIRTASLCSHVHRRTACVASIPSHPTLDGSLLFGCGQVEANHC